MSEKQTTFFTVNCAEKPESPNQCYQHETSEIMIALQRRYTKTRIEVGTIFLFDYEGNRVIFGIGK
jgi:hypothetical protein